MLISFQDLRAEDCLKMADSTEIFTHGKPLTLVDVYDMAADIGREFEVLIDSEGAEKVALLMSKVLRPLEKLEILVKKKNSEQLLIDDLRKTIEDLEIEDSKKTEEIDYLSRNIEHVKLENSKKTEEIIQHTHDLEQLEEHYKIEIRNNFMTTKKLEEEIEKLNSTLSRSIDRENNDYNADLVDKLHNIIQKQKEEIRDFDTNQSNLDMRLGQIKLDNDNLRNTNKELRSELQENKVQINTLMNEIFNLQVWKKEKIIKT